MFRCCIECPLTGGSVAFALNNITYGESLLALFGNYKAKKKKEALNKKTKNKKEQNREKI